MNVIGDVDKTARHFGSLAPGIMSYMVRVRVLSRAGLYNACRLWMTPPPI